MRDGYDLEAPKRPVNLTLNSDLVAKGKGLGLNLSQVAEEALASAVRSAQGKAWLLGNADAIAAYNADVAAHGVFSDGLRTF
jgi:antitoxin CcdA